MRCGISLKKGQSLRTNVSELVYILKCPYCGNILYRAKYSRESCSLCHGLIQNKIRMLPGFVSARVRFYNNKFVKFEE